MHEFKDKIIAHKTIIIIFLLLLVFTRFWNLDHTTRFTRDESQNLVDMHRIWVDKDITLIGPIDDTKTIIYPSLTFYMLLPFAWLGDFSPVSPAYGTAFFGVLAVLLMLYLTYKVNKQHLFLVAVLSLVWVPLLESARWAWNPYLVPFIQSLAFVFLTKSGKINKLISGILFGLTFHLHYLSFIGFASFLVVYGIHQLYKKKISSPIMLGIGFFLTITPFIYFDLKNPPGLFFGRFLNNNLVSTGFAYELQNFWSVFFDNIYNVLVFLAQNNYLAWALGASFAVLLYRDIKKRRRVLIYFVPLIAQIAIISFLPSFQTRYFLLAIIFLLAWLITERGGIEDILVKIALIIMFFGSLTKVPAELTQPKEIPTTYTVDTATDFIKQSIDENSLDNVNLAVLSSPDRDPLGDVYRHTLLVKEVRIQSEYEYHVTDNLFVISTSDIETIRQDPANVLNNFRDGEVRERYDIDNEWTVYRLTK